MTDEQKVQIGRMKDTGCSYRQISESLSIPINTVKSFCRRHREERTAVPVADGQCLECGQNIQQQLGRKPKKFCSDACRMRWWNTHRQVVHMASAHEYTCPHCGRKFKSYARRKYCSHSCYIASRFGGGIVEQG